MINVTKTYLPPQEEYQKYLTEIWEAAWVTNNGPLLKRLEAQLKEYFGVKHLLYTSNGTVVLQMALKALNITGEVITTPFSYVATTSAVIWENCTPVFADIMEENCAIDPSKIEALITPRTQAILATHVYGIPCDTDAIDRIAKKHNLKVIYDAAHTFGTIYKGKHLVTYGDISTISFHATKLFHTIEGGAIMTNDDNLAHQFRLLRSFGHILDDYYIAGINGKNSEFHAAMGLCLLPRVPAFIQRRKEISELYDSLLKTAPLKRPAIPENTEFNYAYYPVLFKNESDLLKVKTALEAVDIFPRRYFFPTLNTLPYLKGQPCPVSERISPCALCLPLYYELETENVQRIAAIVNQTLGA